MIEQIIWLDWFWIVNKKLTRFLWLEVAFLLCYLADKQKYYTANNQLDEEGFFYSTRTKIEEETWCKRRSQENAFKILEEKKFINTKIIWVPAKKYFKLNTQNILTFLTTDCTNCTSGTNVTRCTDMTSYQVQNEPEYNNRIIITDNPPTISNDIVGSPTLTSFVSPHKEKKIEVDNSDSFLYGKKDSQENSDINFSLYGKSNNSSCITDKPITGIPNTSSDQQDFSLSGNEETPQTLKNKPTKKEKKQKTTLEEAVSANPGFQKIITIFHRYLSTKYFQGDDSVEKYKHYAELFIKKLCEANNIPENQKHAVKDFFFTEAEKLVSNYLTKEQVLKSFDRALIGWANRSVGFNSFGKFRQQIPQKQESPTEWNISEATLMQMLNRFKN